MTPPMLPVLQDIAAYLDELRSALVAEYEALTVNDTERLTAIAETKQRLSDILGDLDRERSDLLREAGLDLGRTGVLAYLDRQSASEREPLDVLWQRIETLTHDCRRLNQINGIVIEKRRRRAENALRILQGQTIENDLYSPAGTTPRRPGPGHTLAKA